MSNTSSWRRYLLRVIGIIIAAASSSHSDAQVAGTTTKTLGALFSEIEIGKEGACNEADYLIKTPALPKVHIGKKKLLSSQLIGRTGISQVTSAQQALLRPYQGLKLLPDGATLPQYTPPTDTSKIYRITYSSTGQILSGLVVIPDHSLSNGTVVYDHATQVSKYSGAPSYPSNEACTVITVLTGKGRILAMPDYIGYGVNNRKHPYPLGRDNAPSGIDIIVAAKELAAEVNRSSPIGAALAVTGYSEGGGNSFWLARKIAEDSPDLLGSRLSMIAPMSGPYDMTGATAHSLIVRQPVAAVPSELNQLITFVAKPLLVAYGAQGASDYSLSRLPTMLKSPFLGFVQASPLPTISGRLEYGVGMIGAATLGGYTLLNPNPASLMQPSFVSALQITDKTFPAVALWSANDNIAWIPQDKSGANIPTYATGILQDEVVPFAGSNYPVPNGYIGGPAFFNQGNSQNLIMSLRQKGVTPSDLAWCGIDAQQAPATVLGQRVKLRINHTTGLPPVFSLAAKAIESGSLANLPTIPDPGEGCSNKTVLRACSASN